MMGTNKHRSYVTTWWRMIRAYQRMTQAREIELKQYGLSIRQYSGLVSVQQIGKAATMSEISRRENRRPNTSLAMLRRLEKLGLIRSVSDMRQKNRKRYELTNEGKNTIRTTRNNRSISKVLSVLTEDELTQFYDYLTRVSDAAAEYLGIPDKPPAHYRVNNR